MGFIPFMFRSVVLVVYFCCVKVKRTDCNDFQQDKSLGRIGTHMANTFTNDNEDDDNDMNFRSEAGVSSLRDLIMLCVSSVFSSLAWNGVILFMSHKKDVLCAQAHPLRPSSDKGINEKFIFYSPDSQLG